MGLIFEKTFPIKPTGDDPLHKRNIEERRITYNGIQNLFQIYVSPTSKFCIHLKGKIHKCEHLDLFLDIYCIDKEEFREIVFEFSIKGDKKGLVSYFRKLLGNKLIDEYLEKMKEDKSKLRS